MKRAPYFLSMLFDNFSLVERRETYDNFRDFSVKPVFNLRVKRIDLRELLYLDSKELAKKQADTGVSDFEKASSIIQCVSNSLVLADSNGYVADSAVVTGGTLLPCLVTDLHSIPCEIHYRDERLFLKLLDRKRKKNESVLGYHNKKLTYAYAKEHFPLLSVPLFTLEGLEARLKDASVSDKIEAIEKQLKESGREKKLKGLIDIEDPDERLEALRTIYRREFS
ncbi:hypothetical protein DRJ17_00375 [Candidatus Woesearchaeota archaeon]|nr:MAG: hypothetical protein DRJ17_00375 [Candidatus Woesearchaeota archaeon]